MRKEILALCVISLLAAGCNESAEEERPLEAAAVAETQQALNPTDLPRNFGELKGEPWGNPVASYTTSTTGANQFYGRSVLAYDINGNGKPDYVTSVGNMSKTASHSLVSIVWDDGTPLDIEFNESLTSGANRYGYVMAVGNFCPDWGTRNVIVAAAPSSNSYGGGFGFIYRRNNKGYPKTYKRLNNLSGKTEQIGMDLVVDDINNDGKYDIIYRAAPYEGANWLPRKIGIVYDFCKAGTTLQPDVELEAEDNKISFGKMYVADLDGKGEKELVLIEQNYKATAGEHTPNGAIRFYKLKDNKLVPSRPTLVGEENSAGGVQITSVAFSDINGDKALDLIVGGPYFQGKGKREGMVRTYTNMGAGKAFDTKEALWRVESGRSYANFGTTVVTADVNNDGVNDLIVGAPGTRKVGNDGHGAYGFVYVYLGTKDGSVFSKEAYWRYNSEVALTQNDSFGADVQVVDIDKKGWKDLVVGAPGYAPNSKTLDQGQIHIFTNSESPCYTASRCLIDNVCYEKDESPKDNKCQYCDPTKDNFGFSEVSCDDGGGECMDAPTCDPAKGCVGKAKPDGTNCGAGICFNDGSRLSYIGQTCKKGACTGEVIQNCGDYGCSASGDTMGCITRCTSDADCKSGLVCDTVSGKCVSGNHAPIAMIASDFSGKPGEKIKLDASKSSDPDGDKLTFSWTGTGASYLSSTTTDTTTFTVPASAKPGTIYTLRVTVKDPGGLSSSASTRITVLDPAADNHPPVAVLSENNYTFHTGQELILDASKSSDSDGDKLTYTWNAPDGVTLVGSGSTVSFTSDSAVHGSKFNVSVTVTDPYGASSTATATVNYSVDVVDSIYFDSPKDGDTITSPWMFTGHANADYVSVRNAKNGAKLCHIKTDSDIWRCQLKLGVGQFTFVAYGMTDKGGETGKSAKITFNVEEASVEDPVISIASPKDGDTVSPNPTISGQLANGTKGTIRVFATHDGIVSDPCITNYEANKDIIDWACTFDQDFAPGQYLVFAEVADDNGKSASSSSIYVIVEDDIIIEKPTVSIDSPMNDDIVSLRPDFAGTIQHVSKDGTVDVWMTLNDSVTKVCSASFSVAENADSANWSCTVNSDLAPDTLYLAYARYEAEDITSNVIKVTTQPQEVSSIKIVSPAAGSIHYDNRSVIFVGQAAPMSTAAVYLKYSDDKIEYVCEGVANEKGMWSCETWLMPGDYTAYADDASDDDRIFSPGVSFSVIPYEDTPQNYPHDASGGSCSASTLPTSGSAPWLLLVAGAFGLGLMRRRRNNA